MQKKLGLLDAVLIVSGSMIGSGIFIVSSEMSQQMGSGLWLILAWVLTGVITLFAALSYGELAGMMPKAGGQYVYISRAYGKLVGFVYGWSVFTVIQTGVLAAVAVAFANYLGVLFPKLGTNFKLIEIPFGESASFTLSSGQLVGAALILLLTLINSYGLQGGKWIQRIFTFAKLFAIYGLIATGLYFLFHSDTFTNNFSQGWSMSTSIAENGKMQLGWREISGYSVMVVFLYAMVGSLFSSDAWNAVTFIAGDMENPAKNIPRSLLIGTGLVTITYILCNIAYLAILPVKGNISAFSPDIKQQIINLGISHAKDGRVADAAAQIIFGTAGSIVIAILIMVSTFGCNNGLILSGARLYASMANDKLFFNSASELNKNSVPANALWMQAIWGIILCFSGSYNQLIQYCTLASLLFYILTVLAVFVLRKKEPSEPRPYKTWGYPFVPAIYILIATAIAISIVVKSPIVSLIGIGIVLSGILAYYGIFAKNQPKEIN